MSTQRKPAYWFVSIALVVIIAGLVTWQRFHLAPASESAPAQADRSAREKANPDQMVSPKREADTQFQSARPSSPTTVQTEGSPGLARSETTELNSPSPNTQGATNPIGLVPVPVVFANYTQEIPGSTVTFDMIAVPGGTITIGSPESEAGRDQSDLPAKEVAVKPFWMGKFEVSWPEFVPYVFIDPTNILRQVSKIEGIVDRDGVSHPTKPYGSVYRERGEKGFPAIGMGYPSAAEYCRWLSHKTGRKYRLATEAEWEYACRAGAATPYFWGSDAAPAKEYAWYKDDANDSTHPLGKLKPNKFGLYDIVGNVAEWCQQTDTNAPHVARGGAFSEAIAKLRSAARMIETPEWNELDPQFPQSIWWLSAADFVGFRVVRSFEDEAAPAAAGAAMGAAATTAASPAADNDEVKVNYKRYCQGCHGATGKGDTALGKRNKARDYTDAAVKATLKDDAMFKAIKEGIEVDGKHVMSASGDKLTDAQIKALVQYMKSF